MSDNNQSNLPATTKPPARRRIDLSVIEEIARLVSTKINESEACRILGVKPTTWFQFKSSRRNHDKFAAALDKFRGEKLKMHLDNVEAAAVGAGPHAKADWRASSWMIERALSSDGRFGDRITTEQTGSVTVDINHMMTIAAKAYGNGEVIAPIPPMPKNEFARLIDDTVKKVYGETPKAIDIPAKNKLLSERGENP